MSYLNPTAFWFAAAAAPLIVAFLIRRYRRQRVVSSVVIFRRMAAHTTVRRRFATPQNLVALLLSLLALSGLVLALAQPQGTSIDPRNYILVLDVSASMKTVEDGETESRLIRAQQEIEEFVADLNPDDQLALLTSGVGGSVLVGWTTDPEAVVDALPRARAGGAGTGIAETFDIADAMCQFPESTEIIWVSDGAGQPASVTDCPVRFVRVGEPADNLAISGFSVREADALGLNEVYLAVHNGSDEVREVPVELKLDQTLFEVLVFEVPPRTTLEQVSRIGLPPGDVLQATISADTEGNALPDDDVAYAALRPGARVQATLITEHPRTFLADALSLHPRVDLSIVSPTEVDPAAGPIDLVVIDSAYEGELPKSSHLLVFDAEAERFGLNTSGTVTSPDIIRWTFDDPLFRFVTLNGVHLGGARATTLPDGAVSLADMGDGPLIFRMAVGETEGLFFTFHPDRSDLPLRVAFVNMVANIVEWAQPIEGLGISASVALGERLGATTESFTLVSVGQAGDIRLAANEAIDRPGVYRLETTEGISRGLVAANLFSSAEADLEPASMLGIGAASGWPEAFTAERFPWWILAAAAIGLVCIEWLLPGLLALAYRRRRSASLDRAVGGKPKASIPTANPRVAAAGSE